jgi:hypothetical protein
MILQFLNNKKLTLFEKVKLMRTIDYEIYANISTEKGEIHMNEV